MALNQAQAKGRFSCIQTGSISYKFHLNLEIGSTYHGLSDIEFSLNQIPAQFFLDCKAKQVKSLIINNHEVTKVEHEKGFLILNIEYLRLGQNLVSVLYKTKYDNDGNGCVSFTDVDGKQYIYTQFQPYFANRVFPIFDQPDLKATMELFIISPKQWEQVLSNQSPIYTGQFCFQLLEKFKLSKNSKGFYEKAEGRYTVFPSTKLLPSYLFCFVAGSYKELKLTDTYRNIPMSLYCIQSLFEHLQKMAPFIFQTTIQCMKFFESFFGVEYPFSKYDQVFAHEYKCGAMENAGIVTFNDQYIWTEQVSIQSMFDLANTISHQLSHHWFGNLTTMKWWDDLWLNESFAEFISHFCLEKIRDNMKTIKYQSSMSAFLARKAWGYHEDQLVTTHPISGVVANTSVAESIFDGITYSKGAATMKQLLLLMGEQNFSKGLNSYFKKYAFSNATLSQFMCELQQYFVSPDLSLDDWRKVWLSTSSLNQIEPIWEKGQESQEAELKIIQRPFTQQHPTLRPHKIKIAFFKQDGSFDVAQTLIKAEEENSIRYKGSNKYKAILLNYEDHSFVKVILDTNSINFFSSNNLSKIKDTLTRTMIWRSFFDMVKDGKISALRYIDIFEQNIPYQQSDSIFERHFQYVNSSINYYTPIEYREELNSRVFYFILRLIATTDRSNDNRLVILKSQLCEYAHSYLSVKILLEWRLSKYTPLAQFQMTTVQKWKAVVKAFSRPEFTIQDKMELLENQLKIDESDAGKLQQAKCRALISNQQQYERYYQSFKDPKNEKSTTLKRNQAYGWNHLYHSKRLSIYQNRYFEDIRQASKVLQVDQLELFIEQLLPKTDNLQDLKQGLRSIKLEEDEKLDKTKVQIMKMIGQLQRRQNSYKRFERFDPL